MILRKCLGTELWRTRRNYQRQSIKLIAEGKKEIQETDISDALANTIFSNIDLIDSNKLVKNVYQIFLLWQLSYAEFHLYRNTLARL